MFQKDYEAHENMKNNMARIRKKRMPFYKGRAGTLPPIESQRNGSAPESMSMKTEDEVSRRVKDYNTVDPTNLSQVKMESNPIAE